MKNVGVVNASIYSSYEGAYASVLTGGNSGTIRDSYTSGTIVTSVNGDEHNMVLAGGFVGYNEGTIQNSYTTCNVTASGDYSFAGGFVGMNDHYDIDYHGVIENCYATGSVTATAASSYSGGFAGTNTNWNEIAYEGTEASGIYGTLKNDYYNNTLNTSGGVGNDYASDSHVVGLTTAEMKDSASSITYYTSDSDTVGTTAATSTAALNGGIKLFSADYAFKAWKIDGSTNNGYPVLYTPSSSGGQLRFRRFLRQQ